MSDRVLYGALLFVLTFAGSLAVCAWVLVRLPADHFVSERRTSMFPDQPAWRRTAVRIGRNVGGVVLIAAGALMAIPGVPGQGLLTILIGVLLVDLPGKRALERRIFGIGAVRRAANRLRARYGREPFAWDAD